MTGSWLTSAAAGSVCLVALIIAFRWLLAVQRRVLDHAERIAHLEGQLDPPAVQLPQGDTDTPPEA